MVPICNLVSEFNGLVSKGSAAMPALLLYVNADDYNTCFLVIFFLITIYTIEVFLTPTLRLFLFHQLFFSSSFVNTMKAIHYCNNFY